MTCFGDNTFGQCDIPLKSVINPNKRIELNPNIFDKDQDLIVEEEGVRFGAISAGNDHTCSLSTEKNDLVCFGDNQANQLSFSDEANPYTTFQMISSGGRHNCAMSLSDDVAFNCWGSNQ
mmetsp:Transcript_20510/g.16989  ORF Transcript_20510/g.16989 Transcript_20510/m.16989 type:complete len:120 (-) Transcript_20510:517-876(-)